MRRTLYRHMYNVEDPLEHAAWYVVVNKILYYYPEMFPHLECVNDKAYDQFEIGYLQECAKAGSRNLFVHKEFPEYAQLGVGMMEVDFNNEFVKTVLARMKR